MTTTLTIADRVHGLIAEHLGREPCRVTDDARLFDLGADSLDVIELSSEVEQAFDIALDDDAVADWLSVGDVVRSVEACRARGNP